MGQCKTTGMSEPTMAQTYMQGPVSIGSHGPISRAELDEAATHLKSILDAHPEIQLPVRSFMNDESVHPENWRFGQKPDYTLANYFYVTGKTKAHPEGSLELVVENLVKTWEMERSHKLDPTTHMSVDQDHFSISANGGKRYNNIEANAAGNYNALLDNAD